MFLPGESQGRGNLVGCRLWGRTESDTTEATWQQQQQMHGHPEYQLLIYTGDPVFQGDGNTRVITVSLPWEPNPNLKFVCEHCQSKGS